MAQLAAQDYFTRLQASGLSPFPHPDLAAAFPGMAGLGAAAGQGSGGGNVSGPGGSGGGGGSGSRNEPKPSKSRKKDKSNQNNSGGNMGQGSSGSSYKVIWKNQIQMEFKHVYVRKQYDIMMFTAV